MSDLSSVKKDRLRFTKNKLASTLAIIGIVFNVLYFISVFSSDVGNYFYTVTIGASVVYNLLFLLIVFLSSEGVKSYKMGYAVALIVVGAMQIVRIFYIPMKAHEALVLVGKEMVNAMGNAQFIRVIIYLSLSAAACIAAGVVGIVKTVILENYTEELAQRASLLSDPS